MRATGSPQIGKHFCGCLVKIHTKFNGLPLCPGIPKYSTLQYFLVKMALTTNLKKGQSQKCMNEEGQAHPSSEYMSRLHIRYSWIHTKFNRILFYVPLDQKHLTVSNFWNKRTRRVKHLRMRGGRLTPPWNTCLPRLDMVGYAGDPGLQGLRLPATALALHLGSLEKIWIFGSLSGEIAL